MQDKGIAKYVVRAAIWSGILVGVAEGIRVGLVAKVPFATLLGCMGLVAGFTTAVALASGIALAAAFFLGGWGRAVALTWFDRVVGWVLAGAGVGTVAYVQFALMANRNNRFLAAGVVALASAGMAIAMGVLGPSVARIVAVLRRARNRNGAPTGGASVAGIVLLAPLVLMGFELVLFYLAWRTRAPLRKDVILSRGLLLASVMALSPFVLSSVARRWRGVRGVVAVLGALVLYGVPLAVLIRVRWAQDFQFMPWADVGVIAGMVVATALLTWVFSIRGKPSRLPWLAWLALPVVAGLLILTLSERETIRKPTMARAGLVGRLIAEGQRLTDFDKDGYARYFGGGDCDDGDRERNPGAKDWPDDGIDQDCDGKDASAAGLRSPPYFAVPDAVPSALNILLVTIDTVRADRLGTYGYPRPTSPHIDAMAKEATVFENGWAHAPSTRYSMPAIVTGRWPSAIAWDESIWWPRIAPSQRTMAESLKALGYETGGFFAYLYFNLADRRGFERGIDHYDDSCAALHTNVNGPSESVGTSAAQMSDKGIAFIREHAQGKFFLWLHYYDPHLNYERHAGAPDFGSRQEDLYDGEIWFTDQEFGRVLDELKNRGLWDKTAIVVVGDHGESLGEHGIVAHGYHLYSPHTKVPFILRVPGLPAQRLKVPVGHVDLAPTLVNLARGPHEPAYLGRSMVDYLAGKPGPPPTTPVFQEVSYEGNVKRRALVTETHHLIWNWTPDNTTECYDIGKDPCENHDVWGKGDAECDRLKLELREKVGVLSLPPGYGEKIAFGVSRKGDGVPTPKTLLNARIGSGLRVVGYDLDPSIVPANGQATLVTHFEVLGKIEEGYRLFFHLEGPGGFRNLDHVMVEGAYPLERWRPGQYIRDRMTISTGAFMPVGTYSLYLGLWKGSQRLPVEPPDGGNRLRLVSFDVQAAGHP